MLYVNDPEVRLVVMHQIEAQRSSMSSDSQ